MEYPVYYSLTNIVLIPFEYLGRFKNEKPPPEPGQRGNSKPKPTSNYYLFPEHFL